MMKLSHHDQVKYPKFAAYVRYALPKVLDSPAIIAGFRKYGQIDIATLTRALQWDNGPQITVKELVDAYGLFSAATNPNEINVHSKLVEEFEAGRDLRKTKYGKKVHLLGVTLLHELIHWADNIDGIDFPDEEGALFEADVYGMVIN